MQADTRSCATAKDSTGATIRVGDRVTAISYYDGKPMNTVTVVGIARHGADGTCLTFDAAHDPQSPYHRCHRASKTIRVPRGQ